MSKEKGNICGSCLQSDTCEMKRDPKSYEQINYINGIDVEGPQNSTYCFYFVCEKGVEAANKVILGIKNDEFAPFGTYDKPAQLELRDHGVLGRFVDCNSIFVTKNGKKVFLRRLGSETSKMKRKKALLNVLQETS